MDELAADADRHPPTLSVRNRAGADESRIDKHPAYVELERLAYSDGLARCRIAAARWAGRAHAGGGQVRAQPSVRAGRVRPVLPVSMTDSLARTLRKFGAPELVDKQLPQVTSLDSTACARAPCS